MLLLGEVAQTLFAKLELLEYNKIEFFSITVVVIVVNLNIKGDKWLQSIVTTLPGGSLSSCHISYMLRAVPTVNLLHEFIKRK